MPTQSITFSKNRGIDLFDPVSKSSFGVPSAYCDDLSGCGGDTHNRGSLAFNTNYRENCELPVLGLQFSYSGFATRTITPSSFSQLSITDGTVTYTASVAALLQFLLETTPATVASIFGVLNIPAASQNLYIAKIIGPQIFLYKKSNKRLIATLQRPIAEIVQDQCLQDIGKKRASSLALYGFDLATCKATTLWQASISVSYGTGLYPTDVAAQTNVPGDILNNLLVTDMLNAVDSTIGCGITQTSIEQTWLDLLNTTVNIGTP